MRRGLNIAAILLAGSLSACSANGGNNVGAADGNAAENMTNSATGNTPARSNPNAERAAALNAMSPAERRTAYSEMAQCAALAEAMKALAGRRVQGAPLGARRDRLVLEEMSWRGRAGAMRAHTSLPANALDMSYAEVTEDIETRARAVQRRRGTRSLDDFSDEIERDAKQCYEDLT